MNLILIEYLVIQCIEITFGASRIYNCIIDNIVLKIFWNEDEYVSIYLL